jgi:hypothetical protein
LDNSECYPAYTPEQEKTCSNQDIGNNLSDIEKDAYGNTFALFFDYKLFPKMGVKLIDSAGNVKRYVSNKPIPCWTNAGGSKFKHFLFRYSQLNEIDKCLFKNVPALFEIFVNGYKYDEFLFDEQISFNDTTCKAMDKTYHVPYYFSIGGGTFGLRYSYHISPYWAWDTGEDLKMQEYETNQNVTAFSSAQTYFFNSASTVVIA